MLYANQLIRYSTGCLDQTKNTHTNGPESAYTRPNKWENIPTYLRVFQTSADNVCKYLKQFEPECLSCSPPMNWSHQTVEQRAAMAHRIVYATDVGHQNVVLNPLGASYDGQFDVHCVLKGEEFQSNPVSVADMGIIPHLCTAHTVKEGRSYFLFLMGSEEEVVTVHEVNYEIGVFDDLDGYRDIFDREFEFYSRCLGGNSPTSENPNAPVER